METWSPEIFFVELGARSLSLLGARTEMLILAKWNPGVELDGALNPEFSGALHFQAIEPWCPFQSQAPVIFRARSYIFKNL